MSRYRHCTSTHPITHFFGFALNPTYLNNVRTFCDKDELSCRFQIHLQSLHLPRFPASLQAPGLNPIPVALESPTCRGEETDGRVFGLGGLFPGEITPIYIGLECGLGWGEKVKIKKSQRIWHQVFLCQLDCLLLYNITEQCHWTHFTVLSSCWAMRFFITTNYILSSLPCSSARSHLRQISQSCYLTVNGQPTY